MTFKNKYSPSASIDVKISGDNNQLSQVKTTKFLGVLIDDNLSWKTHITHACNIISRQKYKKCNIFFPCIIFFSQVVRIPYRYVCG